MLRFPNRNLTMPGRTAHTKPLLPLIVIGLFAGELPVDAYLDPGSGSMLLQILLGGFAAAGVIVKLYWHRLTTLFRRKDVEHDRW